MGFTVAIVGRPNVGKSTLFNRLIGDRKAIIDNVSGVTRDRQYGEVEWNGKKFNLIDTGGFVPNSDDVFEAAISEQVIIAMEEASLIVFMVDCMTGITDLDDKMVRLLRRSKKQVMVVVNKVDNGTRLLLANEFYSLGFEETHFLSSVTGGGTGEFLDALVSYIDIADNEDSDEDIPKITIVGQPNVGKSSLLNAFVGKTRNIVTDVAGTTRDSIDTHYKKYDKNFILVDTAGLRKKAKVQENIEFYSTIRAVNAIDESDVCMLLIDAQTGIEAQDLKILNTIERKKKGVVILVNKWDLIENKNEKIHEIKDKIIRKIAPFTDIPIIFISALEKQRVMNAIDESIAVYHRRRLKIPTSELNNKMLEEIERNTPPSIKGKFVKIKYITQLPTYSPTFAFFCNLPQYIKQPYINFLENRIREHWDFAGVVIKVFIRKK